MSEPSFEIRVSHSIRDIEQSAWDGLGSVSGSPFVSYTWLDCLEGSGCVGSIRNGATSRATKHASGWFACHLTLYRDGTLIAACPAYLKGNSEGEFVFDWSWADLASRMGISYYPKLIVAVPFSPVTGERVLIAAGEDEDKVTRMMAQAVTEIAEKLQANNAHVLFPKEKEALTWTRAGYAHRLGVQYHWHNKGFATFDDFLATFNSKRRHQIKRECGQAEKDGVLIETIDPDRITPEVVDAMFTFYLATVDKFAWGRRYLNRAFFELLASRFKRNLAWVVATQNGVPIAGAFNIQGSNRLYGRYWGATVDMPFLHFNVCYYHGIKHAIAHGLEAFEPGAGGEHKRPRGFVPTMTHSVHYIENPRMRNAIESFLDRERAAITEFVESGGEE